MVYARIIVCCPSIDVGAAISLLSFSYSIPYCPQIGLYAPLPSWYRKTFRSGNVPWGIKRDMKVGYLLMAAHLYGGTRDRFPSFCSWADVHVHIRHWQMLLGVGHYIYSCWIFILLGLLKFYFLILLLYGRF